MNNPSVSDNHNDERVHGYISDDDSDGSSPTGIFDGYNNENVVIFDNDNDASVVTR